MVNKLKPCSKCEYQVIPSNMVEHPRWEFYIECPVCGNRCTPMDNEEKAVKAWNDKNRKF